MNLTYAVADLHGSFDLLRRALVEIERHAEEQGAGSRRIVFLGDYIDRGPQSRAIIECLVAGPRDGWRWVCLKGNHEDIMVRTIRDRLHPEWWFRNGGGATLLSYGHPPDEDDYDPNVVPDAHVAWIEALPSMYVDDRRVFVHAGLDPSRGLDDQDGETLLWKKYDEADERGYGDRHVVHGHHKHKDGPLLLRDRTNLDTFAWNTGRLVVGIFDDALPGGPVALIEILRETEGDHDRRPL